MTRNTLVGHVSTTSEDSRGRIRPVPAHVIAQIKSSATITSLGPVVLELVKNSLDAHATKIEVAVDFARGGCAIEDNGLGILPHEFREEGGLGKLYCTHPVLRAARTC